MANSTSCFMHGAELSSQVEFEIMPSMAAGFGVTVTNAVFDLKYRFPEILLEVLTEILQFYMYDVEEATTYLQLKGWTSRKPPTSPTKKQTSSSVRSPSKGSTTSGKRRGWHFNFKRDSSTKQSPVLSPTSPHGHVLSISTPGTASFGSPRTLNSPRPLNTSVDGLSCRTDSTGSIGLSSTSSISNLSSGLPSPTSLDERLGSARDLLQYDYGGRLRSQSVSAVRPMFDEAGVVIDTSNAVQRSRSGEMYPASDQLFPHSTIPDLDLKEVAFVDSVITSIDSPITPIVTEAATTTAPTVQPTSSSSAPAYVLLSPTSVSSSTARGGSVDNKASSNPESRRRRTPSVSYGDVFGQSDSSMLSRELLSASSSPSVSSSSVSSASSRPKMASRSVSAKNISLVRSAGALPRMSFDDTVWMVSGRKISPTSGNSLRPSLSSGLGKEDTTQLLLDTKRGRLSRTPTSERLPIPIPPSSSERRNQSRPRSFSVGIAAPSNPLRSSGGSVSTPLAPRNASGGSSTKFSMPKWLKKKRGSMSSHDEASIQRSESELELVQEEGEEEGGDAGQMLSMMEFLEG
eukprot:TRINITY_DN5369_c0_g1_i2.p1 TRINITY_DN5369_c0_g1~~TRINITY_DN5369_c0_g1_i2.p1  ORF type:complete len:574 (-),score=77.77 TRINITY_DN5369_c0_g1_i2:24-1745(-)